MTTEEKLKDLILTKYRSIREFTQIIDMPYSTFSTIMVRGIENSNVTSVIKICKALGISADALADGKIHYVTDKSCNEPLDIDFVLHDIRHELLTNENLVFRNKTIEQNDRRLIVNYLDVIIDLVIKQMETK